MPTYLSSQTLDALSIDLCPCLTGRHVAFARYGEKTDFAEFIVYGELNLPDGSPDDLYEQHARRVLAIVIARSPGYRPTLKWDPASKYEVTIEMGSYPV